jgi:hypothetical protein
MADWDVPYRPTFDPMRQMPARPPLPIRPPGTDIGPIPPIGPRGQPQGGQGMADYNQMIAQSMQGQSKGQRFGNILGGAMGLGGGAAQSSGGILQQIMQMQQMKKQQQALAQQYGQQPIQWGQSPQQSQGQQQQLPMPRVR